MERISTTVEFTEDNEVIWAANFDGILLGNQIYAKATSAITKSDPKYIKLNVSDTEDRTKHWESSNPIIHKEITVEKNTGFSDNRIKKSSVAGRILVALLA